MTGKLQAAANGSMVQLTYQGPQGPWMYAVPTPSVMMAIEIVELINKNAAENRPSGDPAVALRAVDVISAMVDNAERRTVEHVADLRAMLVARASTQINP